jgi:hypothetical protein
MARFMYEQIKGSTLRILPALRHSVLVEAPEQIAFLLLDFLRPPNSASATAGGTAAAAR